MRSSSVLYLVLLLALWLLASATPPDSVAPAGLYGYWFSLPRMFQGLPGNVSLVHPSDPKQGPPLFQKEWISLFGGQSVIDSTTQTFYLPALTPVPGMKTENDTIYGVDLTRKAATIAVRLPFTCQILQLDARTNRLIVGGIYIPMNETEGRTKAARSRPGLRLNKTATQMRLQRMKRQSHLKIQVEFGVIELGAPKPSYEKKGSFPTGYFFTVLAGSFSTIDSNNRKLYAAMSTSSTVGQGDALITLNLDTFKTSVDSFGPTPKYEAGGLYMHGDTLMALTSPVSSGKLPYVSNTTVCKFDFTRSKWTPMNVWQSEFLLFVIDGIVAAAPGGEEFYAIVGDGEGPPVALVTGDTATGEMKSAVVFPGKTSLAYIQPASIAVLS